MINILYVVLFSVKLLPFKSTLISVITYFHIKWNIADILIGGKKMKEKEFLVLKSWFKDLYKVKHILI